jgi:hypothetical protein
MDMAFRVSQKTLYYGNVGAEIDEVSAIFDKESDAMDAELELARLRVESTSPSKHQRLHATTVLTEIKSRRARISQQFQEALKSRAEVTAGAFSSRITSYVSCCAIDASGQSRPSRSVRPVERAQSEAGRW